MLVRTIVLRHQRRHGAAGLPRRARPGPAGRRDDRRAGRHVPVSVPLRIQLRRRRRGEPVGARRRERWSSRSTRIRTASSPTPTTSSRSARSIRREATLFPLVETALQITLDAGPVLDDTVVVFGLGAVGMLTALCSSGPAPAWSRSSRAPGGATPPPASASSPSHRRSCTTRWPPDGRPPLVPLVDRGVRQPRRAPAGAPAVGARGHGLVASWYGTKEVSLPLGSEFHRRRLTIRSTQVSTIPARLSDRWDAERRRRDRRRRCSTSSRSTALATHTFPFEAAAERLRRDRRGRDGTDPRRVGVRIAHVPSRHRHRVHRAAHHARRRRPRRRAPLARLPARGRRRARDSSTTAAWCATSTCSTPRCSGSTTSCADKNLDVIRPADAEAVTVEVFARWAHDFARRRDLAGTGAEMLAVRVWESATAVRRLQRPARLTSRADAAAELVVSLLTRGSPDAGDRRAPLPPPDGRGGAGAGRRASSSSPYRLAATRSAEARGVVVVDSITAWSVAPWVAARSAAGRPARGDPPPAAGRRRAGPAAHGAAAPARPGVLPALRPADRREHGARPRARATTTACPRRGCCVVEPGQRPAARRRRDGRRPAPRPPRSPCSASATGCRTRACWSCSTRSRRCPTDHVTLHLAGRADVDVGLHRPGARPARARPTWPDRVVVHGAVSRDEVGRALRRRRRVRRSRATPRRTERCTARRWRPGSRRSAGGRATCPTSSRTAARAASSTRRRRRPERRAAAARRPTTMARHAGRRRPRTRSAPPDVERRRRRLLRCATRDWRRRRLNRGASAPTTPGRDRAARHG